MSIFKNRVFMGIMALCVAGIVCFVMFPKFTQQQNKIMKVAALTKDVPAGTTITGEMVTEKTVGGYGISPDVIKDSADIVGKVAVKDLSSRDSLYADEVVTKAEYDSKYGIQSQLTSGSQLVSITVKNLAVTVSGQIKPGSKVDVAYAHKTTTSNEDGTATKEVISVVRPDELKNLTVYSISNSDLQTSDKADTSKAFIPATVTFVATPEQANLLIGLEYSSSDSMHILLDGQDVSAATASK